jgi:hypothetical protein
MIAEIMAPARRRALADCIDAPWMATTRAKTFEQYRNGADPHR